jgi:F-type H+-transporting ATPase subunit a
VRYFAKFINTPALENAGKNPMGIMDFGIGFLEMISEISRIISFGFRLFGNIFAGQVLLFLIPFLAGALLPLAIYGFEMFVGVIQAFVFAMLLLVFASMAMAGHGDHEEQHE